MDLFPKPPSVLQTASEFDQWAQNVISRAEYNKNVPQPVVNIRGYGAKGDGVTDDTAAIQAALNYAASVGGGTVFIPQGNYKVTSKLVLPAIPLQIIGVGVASKIAAYHNDSVFFYDNDASVGYYVIKNLYIYAQSGYATLYAFNILRNFHRFRFENIKVVGMRAAWRMRQCWIGLFINCHTQDCEQAFTTADSYINSVAFIGGEFKDCALTGKNYAFYIYDGYGIYFHNVCIEGNKYGGIQLKKPRNVVIRDCYFEANKDSAQTDWVADVTIDGTVDATARGILIQGNLFDGGSIEQTSFGVLINRADNALIEGNYFIRHGVAGIRIGSATEIQNVRVGLNASDETTYVQNVSSADTVKVDTW